MTAQPDEVEVTQYLRPDGRTKKVYAPVGIEHAKMAKDMTISSEVLTTGGVAIYVQFADEPVECEAVDIAENTKQSAPNDPVEVLKRLIERKRRERPLGTSTD